MDARQLASVGVATAQVPRAKFCARSSRQVIGFWRTVPDREAALVEVHLARPLDAATRSALEQELERYGRFLQLPARLLAAS